MQPDILIPSKAHYDDLSFPAEKLCVVGVKTTCKDRWRQVLNEGRRVTNKHILTTQKGISRNQLDEMASANVTLIVPQSFQKDYPAGSGTTILSLESFVASMRDLAFDVPARPNELF